jgi:hypothetical protein
MTVVFNASAAVNASASSAALGKRPIILLRMNRHPAKARRKFNKDAEQLVRDAGFEPATSCV